MNKHISSRTPLVQPRKYSEREPHADASFRRHSVAKSHAGDTCRFLVEQDDVGNFTKLGAFLADVLLDIKDRRGIFLLYC